MKKLIALACFFILITLTLSISVFAQNGCTVLQADNTSLAVQSFKLSHWSGLMELPFLLISIGFAFATAHALKGGKFGKGMNLIAWGFLVMAVGHLHMQVEHFYGFNLFKYIFGELGGTLAWFVALLITWGFSGMGFYSILKASKGQ